MNARQLQKELVNDLADLFRGRRFSTPSAPYQNVPLNVFGQQLPKRKDEEDEDPFPYVVVRIDSGKIESQTHAQKVRVLLLVGVYDDGEDNQGHRTVLEIIEAIQAHYEARPLLAGMFTFCDPFEWALQDEESWPYYFGAATAEFAIPAPRREASALT